MSTVGVDGGGRGVKAPLTASFKDPHELIALTETADAVVIGPAAGVSETTRANVEALARGSDAGTRCRCDHGVQGRSGDAGRAAGAPAVLTPHMGEFERLFPGLMEMRRPRLRRRVRRRDSGAVVLFKGPDTVIAARTGGRR